MWDYFSRYKEATFVLVARMQECVGWMERAVEQEQTNVFFSTA
jgi:hypothetical protein